MKEENTLARSNTGVPPFWVSSVRRVSSSLLHERIFRHRLETCTLF